MELQPLPETTPTAAEQPLMQRIGDVALRAANLVQGKVAGAYDYLKREGRKIAVHAALAGLALTSSAGLIVRESTPVKAAAAHTENGGPSSNPGADVSYGWNVYVNFNRAATQKIEYDHVAGTTSVGLGGLACKLIPFAPAEAACEAVAILKAGEFEWAVERAQANNDCLQVKIPYEALDVPVGAGLVGVDFGWAPCKG